MDIHWHLVSVRMYVCEHILPSVIWACKGQSDACVFVCLHVHPMNSQVPVYIHVYQWLVCTCVQVFVHISHTILHVYTTRCVVHNLKGMSSACTSARVSCASVCLCESGSVSPTTHQAVCSQCGAANDFNESAFWIHIFFIKYITLKQNQWETLIRAFVDAFCGGVFLLRSSRRRMLGFI